MTIRAIVQGRLWKPAEQRQSSMGKPYVTATLAIDGAADGQPRFARVTGFGDEATALLALGKGAPVAVSGRLELAVWTPEGKPPEVQVRMVADAVLTVEPGRSRAAERPPRAAQEARHDDPWDAMPLTLPARSRVRPYGPDSRSAGPVRFLRREPICARRHSGTRTRPAVTLTRLPSPDRDLAVADRLAPEAVRHRRRAR